MEFTTNTIGSTIFQSLMVRQEDLPDEFVIKMLTNNEIDGLLPLSVIQKNLDFDIRYNVTSLIPLAQFMQDRLTKRKVLNVISSIVKAASNVGEYMLGADGLVMDEKYIYVNIADGESYLMYLPIANPYSTDVVSFVKKLFTSFQYDPNEDSGYVLKFMNAFNSGMIQTVDDLYDLILNIDKNGTSNSQPVQKTPVSSPAPSVAPQVASTPKAVETPNVAPVSGPAPTPTPAPAAIPTPANKAEDNGKAKPFLFGKPSVPKAEKAKPEKVKAEKPKNKLFGGKSAETPAASSVPSSPVIPVRIPGSAGATPAFAIPGQAPVVQPSTPVVPQTPQASAPQAPVGNNSPVNASVNNNDISGKPLTPQEESMAQARVPQQGIIRDYGNTVVMNQNNSNATMMLDDMDKKEDGFVKPSVTRVANNQKMYMEKNILKMGKESDYVDFYIGNNQTISRSHADILCEDGKYYVRDNNSKNHTYVNGQQIVPGQLVPIEHNTEIMLSNEVFLFQLS